MRLIEIEAYKKGYMDGSLSVTEELLKQNDLYQKGRADAIDDVFKLIITLLNKDRPNGCYCVDNTELCPYIECIHDMANGLNELKEQNNGRD